MIIDFKNLNGGGGQPYVLPIASASTLGGIKVGNNLSINATTGVLDAEVPDISGLAETEYVDSEIERVEGEIPDVTDYATKTELNTGLAAKQNTLTAGDNITISNNTISAQTYPIVIDYNTWTTSIPDMYNNPERYVIKYEDNENNITWHLYPTRRYFSASSNKRCFEAISIGANGTLLMFVGTVVRSAGTKNDIYYHEYDLTPKTV